MALISLLTRFYSCRTTTTLPLKTALMSSNFNHITNIIQDKKELKKTDKHIFRSYWESISTHFSHSKTILQTLESNEFKEFIERNKKSSTIREFYRREILFNKNNETLLQPILPGKRDPLSFCIKDSISTKDVTIAADLFLLYYRLYPTEPLRVELASDIISSLAFKNAKKDILHLIRFLKLARLFKKKNNKLNLTTWQGNEISKKALRLNDTPALKKHILREVMENSTNSNMTSRDENINAAYRLIQNDYTNRNAAGVFYTWKEICHHYEDLTEHDPKILNIVLKSSMNNKIYRAVCKEVVSNLPPKYFSNDPIILPTIINYTVKTGNLKKCQELMNTINENILPHNISNVLQTKRCLNSLLKLHLKFNDSAGVDDVLKQIHELHGGHTQEDFQAITSHILKNKTLENISKAVKLASQIPEKKALLAYITIINTIVDWQIASNGRFDQKSMHIIARLLDKANKADPFKKSTMWSILASLYIKKLVHYKNFKNDTINLDLAKLIFLKSSSKGEKNCTVDPFNHSSPQNIILKINNNNEIVILRNIGLASIKGLRKDIFLWCCTELYHKGVPIKELVLDWLLMYNYKFRSIKTLQDAKLKKKLSITGLPFIQNTLK